MKIAIDIDDVLADSVVSLLEYYNDKYRTKITVKDLSEYSYWGFLGETREESNQKYFDFCETKYFDTIKPSRGAIAAVDSILKKHEIFLITGRPLFMKEKTEAWVQKYFPDKFSGVLFTNDRIDRNDISPYWGKKKADICDEIGAELLIDDLFEYVRESDHLKVIIYDQVWNQGEMSGHMVRMSGWKKIAESLR